MRWTPDGGAVQRLGAALAAVLLTAGPASGSPRPSALIVWAWERPEDLRFAGPGVEIADHSGFMVLAGDRLFARGRRFPLLAAAAAVTTSVVHVQIDRRVRLRWSDALRRRTVDAVVAYGLARRPQRLQIDFEVGASERPVLLGVLAGVAARLPAGTALSMTAIASWCDGERWLDAAPVDEIVPMLFRMGQQGAALRTRLAHGGDFANPRCRTALAVSTDAPIARAPPGRRVYLFNPHSWTPAALDGVRGEIARWGS